MGEIKYIDVTIRPEYISQPYNEPIARCTIRVKVWGKDEFQVTKMIDDRDFQSRFDWFIENAVKVIKEEFSK